LGKTGSRSGGKKKKKNLHLRLYRGQSLKKKKKPLMSMKKYKGGENAEGGSFSSEAQAHHGLWEEKEMGSNDASRQQ